jgi:formate dehydrogenase gamma subunit
MKRALFRRSSEVLCGLLLLGSAEAAKRAPSRPQAEQHRPFFLRNSSGEIIDPLSGRNAGDPYSPMQTCGASKCHDYTFITKGYHFEQGAESIRDDFDPQHPWVLSPGMFGNHRPAALRQLARKKNAHPGEIDITVWQWVTESAPGEPPCASCHPGGGPLERDRNGQRYDAVLAKNPALANSFDGDYRGSHWALSGVLEADCLICHSAAYDFAERTRELRRGNLKWAATVAAGLGVVEGQVLDPATGAVTGKTPRVTYHKRLFNADGRIVPPILKSPSDRSCLGCHAEPDLQKRGFTWNDPVNPDVHNQQQMRCITCHISGLDHQIFRGRPTVEKVRPDLQATMRDCAGCHLTGYNGASVPAHLAIPPSHLRKISCKTCHIPALHRAAGKFFDTTRGDVQWDVVGAATRIGEPQIWYPAYRKIDGKIQPVNPILGVWWGNRDEDGIVHPLFARELRAAWAEFKNAVTDDNGDGVPEVNRPEEIEAGLRAFEKTLPQSKRFRKVHPLFFKGDKVWELGGAGVVSSARPPTWERVGFSVSHNVAPSKEALGAGGCVDCHSREGRFFSRTDLVDPFDVTGKEVREPSYRGIGLSELSYTLFSIYWSLARPWLGLVLIVVFFLITLHFTRFGPHDFGGKPLNPRPDDYDRVKRFSWFERMLHLTVLVTFLFLAFTGLAFSFDGWRWMQLVFGDNVTPRDWHGWLGYVFGAGVLLMLLRWWRDALLVRSDRQWFKAFGGYLGAHAPVPAERFNAGQKLYFWTVVSGGLLLLASGVVLYFAESLSLDAVFIAAMLHNLAALFGVAGVISHIYLSTAANPGTVQAIFAGWVTKLWARMHHPLWYEKITHHPAVDEEEPEKKKASGS